jgi:transcriptional antiterminator RfaH
MYWIAAQLLPRREGLALHCLKLAGYSTYLPRIRERRVVRGRRITVTLPLFPGYCFLTIEDQWHAARWSPGIAGLIMDGIVPALVPDKVIAEIRAREIRGLIDLPRLRPGDRVQVTRGVLARLSGLYAGQAPHDRVQVLLSLLGAARQVTLPAAAVVALC